MFPEPPLTFSISKENHNSVLFIFLGASNLARSFYGLKRCITRCLFPRPVSFIHAMGPGRGYISQGGILNITYPPILHCDILKAAYNRRKINQQVVALITDIGNDIMYGVSAEEIIGGLKSLFSDLSELEANIFITSIPIDLKNDIGEFYFRILRQIFFPKSPAEYSQTSKTIEIVNQFILQSSNAKISVIDDMQQFCGIDKIHYSLLKSHLAWSHIASDLTGTLDVNAPPKLDVSELVLSLANNFARILFIDILGMVNKTNETF